MTGDVVTVVLEPDVAKVFDSSDGKPAATLPHLSHSRSRTSNSGSQASSEGRPAPEGQPFGREAFVLGDEIGRRRESVREAWERARVAAGIGDFHLADLRHEAASRWEEAGVGTHVVTAT
jgi:integrase